MFTSPLFVSNVDRTDIGVKPVGGYDCVDLTKFVLAILVVAIHTHVPLLSQLGRLAVPYFFLVSSFLFFRRYDKLKDTLQQCMFLKRYCVRLLALYGFWWLVYSPFVVYRLVRSVESGRGVAGVAKLVAQTVVNGRSPGFDQGWYLIASVYGMVALTLLMRKLPNPVLLPIGIGAEIPTMLATTYAGLIPSFVDRWLISGYVYSFARSILYFTLGMICARNPAWLRGPQRYAWACLGCGALLALELWLTDRVGVAHPAWYLDSSMFLAPTTLALFAFSATFKFQTRFALYFRQASTFIYLSHVLVLNAVEWLFTRVHVDQERVTARLALFVVVASVCLLSNAAVDKLSEKDTFRWLVRLR